MTSQLISQIGKLCAAELVFFNTEFKKLKTDDQRSQFIQDRLLLSPVQASQLLTQMKKKQLPRRDSIKNLLDSGALLIETTENQRNLPADQPKYVDQELMNVFYVNLVDVQQQFIEINNIFRPLTSGIQKTKPGSQEAKAEKCLIQLFNQTLAPTINKKPAPTKRSQPKMSTALPSAAKLRKQLEKTKKNISTGVELSTKDLSKEQSIAASPVRERKSPSKSALSDATHMTAIRHFDKKVNLDEVEEIKNVDFDNFTPGKGLDVPVVRKTSYEEPLQPPFLAKNLDLDLEMIKEEPNQDYATKAALINDLKIVEEPTNLLVEVNKD